MTPGLPDPTSPSTSLPTTAEGSGPTLLGVYDPYLTQMQPPNLDQPQTPSSTPSTAAPSGPVLNDVPYRHLPQISFKGCQWPDSGQGSANRQPDQSLISVMAGRGYEPTVCATIPMVKGGRPSQRYGGFLWPCNSQAECSTPSSETSSQQMPPGQTPRSQAQRSSQTPSGQMCPPGPVWMPPMQNPSHPPFQLFIPR